MIGAGALLDPWLASHVYVVIALYVLAVLAVSWDYAREYWHIWRIRRLIRRNRERAEHYRRELARLERRRASTEGREH
jgi:hypothetical protein